MDIALLSLLSRFEAIKNDYFYYVFYVSARCYLWSFLERITLWRLQSTYFPLGDWTSECDQENTCNWFTLVCLFLRQNWPNISPPMQAKIYSNFPSLHLCILAQFVLCQKQKTSKTHLVDGREMNISFPLYFFQRTGLPFVSCLHTP